MTSVMWFRRDLRLADAGIELVRTGSPYAVAPGRVRNGSGDPYKVFTPFSRAWADHGWRGPVDTPTGVSWLTLDEHTDEGTTDLPDPRLPAGLELPEADLSRRRSDGARVYRTELAWREFYADVLHTRPETAREYYKPEFARLSYDRPGAQLEAWQEGRTGFPIVDAGMRQLRATGWVHNRVRMIVASFLVKDLHVEWQHGARHFLHWLVDGDLASNNHGWQWVAGSGTDASPFFRVFNPTTQGKKFDPRGDYVRRWVEELSDPEQVPDPHDPDPDTRDLVGYPAPMVDHKEERQEALDRWEKIRG